MTFYIRKHTCHIVSQYLNKVTELDQTPIVLISPSATHYPSQRLKK